MAPVRPPASDVWRGFSPGMSGFANVMTRMSGSDPGRTGEHLEMLDDRTQGQGGEELQPAQDEDDADQQADEQRP
ncbi:hypothetical protein LTR94_037332, partial [Friedmanniomyces endolithicus]